MSSLEKNSKGEPNEKQRVCPSCRMTISVLATKCRYCGEEVGKPKDETRNLTADDLGGETIFHRAPSGSVMDALEAFRLEETLGENEDEATPKRRSGLFKKTTPEPAKKSASDLPELDSNSQALADAVGLSSTRSYSSVRRKSGAHRNQRTLQERLMLGGGIAAAVVVLLFAGIKGFGWIQSYANARNTDDATGFVNRVPEMLARENQPPPLTILEEGARALRENDTSENRKYLELAMDPVIDEFNRLIHPEKYDRRAIWTMDNLTKASALASRAQSIYANERTAEMQREIEDELKAYRMTLLTTKGTAAQFAVNLPQQGTVWFEKESLIADRFKVKTVQGNIVKVEDERRPDAAGNPRIVTYKAGTSRPL
jgi:hypothetical protein